jgi:hypothetical protein
LMQAEYTSMNGISHIIDNGFTIVFGYINDVSDTFRRQCL